MVETAKTIIQETTQKHTTDLSTATNPNSASENLRTPQFNKPVSMDVYERMRPTRPGSRPPVVDRLRGHQKKLKEKKRVRTRETKRNGKKKKKSRAPLIPALAMPTRIAITQAKAVKPTRPAPIQSNRKPNHRFAKLLFVQNLVL